MFFYNRFLPLWVKLCVKKSENMNRTKHFVLDYNVVTQKLQNGILLKNKKAHNYITVTGLV